MKLVRHGERGRERPGILDGEGRVRDLGSTCEDFAPAFFAENGMRELHGIDVEHLPIVPANARLGPCIAQPGNFIAIGLNYVQHARETNAPIPEDPILFNKAPSCLSGPFDPVILPKNSVKTDWEVELALVIAKETHCVEEADALSCVAGYFICNDVSEREFQLERSGQWVKGKMAPTFGPIGPWLVTADEVPDPQNLRLWLELNGKRIQDSSTSDMIFTIARIVADTSHTCYSNPATSSPPARRKASALA
jgi:2-keto-4-pentenoate hydratase/2-oxohepta-3-ene-1,7-dioic acid hydratase in catechol pathway